MRSAFAAGALTLLCACKSSPAQREEEHRQFQFVLDLRAREGIQAPLGVVSSPGIRFDWGFSPVEYDPKEDYRSTRALRWIGQRAAIRVQRHGDKPMKLGIWGWVNSRVLRTKPAVSAYFDGQLLSSMVVEEVKDDGFGDFEVGGAVTPDMFQGSQWAIVELDLSSVGFHWAEPPKLQVAFVSSVAWMELP